VSEIWQKVKCGPAGMRAYSLGFIGFGVRDKVRVGVCARVSAFYFLPHLQTAEAHIPQARSLPITVKFGVMLIECILQISLCRSSKRHS